MASSQQSGDFASPGSDAAAAENSAIPAGPSRANGRSEIVPRGLVIAVGLLGVSVFINYIDRANLGIAAPFLRGELGLTPAQLGILLSSFFWTYAAFQILSGWLVDRYNVNWVLAAGFFLWSLATAATGIVYGFAALLLLRLILGAGESVAFPSYSRILARHCPESMRGRANSVINSGIAAGPAFGIFFGARLVARYGWRPFFVGLGLLSLLWLLPWMKWMPTGHGIARQSSNTAPSLLRILEERSAWGSFAGLFAYNYLSYFLLTWLPYYLTHARNFSMTTMGNIGAATYGTLATSILIAGWMSDFWIARGGSPTVVRKTFTALGLAVASVSCFAVELTGSDSRLAVSFLLVTCAAAGLCSSNLWAITQTLAGPNVAGRWTGLQNFAGNLAGVLSPALTGLVVTETGSFFWAFVVTAAVLMAGAFSWVFVVGRVEPVRWDAIVPDGEDAMRSDAPLA